MRYAFLALAGLSLALGIIGIFVPGLPTTVFILIAGWATARSSPRFHAWLENHPRFGPILRNWRQSGAVPRRAKWAATITMSLSATILFATVHKLWIAELATACMAAVAIWLWLRPEPEAPAAVSRSGGPDAVP
ncbi:MAG: YbaN family protein [Solimonas sp.]